MCTQLLLILILQILKITYLLFLFQKCSSTSKNTKKQHKTTNNCDQITNYHTIENREHEEIEITMAVEDFDIEDSEISIEQRQSTQAGLRTCEKGCQTIFTNAKQSVDIGIQTCWDMFHSKQNDIACQTSSDISNSPKNSNDIGCQTDHYQKEDDRIYTEEQLQILREMVRNNQNQLLF